MLDLALAAGAACLTLIVCGPFLFALGREAERQEREDERADMLSDETMRRWR